MIERQAGLEAIEVVGCGAFGDALTKSLRFLTREDVRRVGKVFCQDEGAINMPVEKAPKIIFLAIPSNATNEAGEPAIPEFINKYKSSDLILTSKGEDAWQVYRNLDDGQKKRVFILSGPNIAEQMADPSAAIIAGTNHRRAKQLQSILNSRKLRFYASESPDVIQMSGILKNLLVFELGRVWDQLSPDEKIEMLIFAINTGYSVVQTHCPDRQKASEFFGIAGVGDLLLCTEFFPEGGGSRNFKAGKMKSEGHTDEDILEKFRTIEGLKMSNELHGGLDEIPELLDTSEMLYFRDVINHTGQFGTIPQKLKRKDTYHPAYKTLINEVFRHFEEVIEIVEEEREGRIQFRENTKAWFFCRLFRELVSVYGTGEYENILRTMFQYVLQEREVVRASEPQEVLHLPLTRFHKSPLLLWFTKINKRKATKRAVDAILLGRNTESEGLSKLDFLK